MLSSKIEVDTFAYSSNIVDKTISNDSFNKLLTKNAIGLVSK